MKSTGLYDLDIPDIYVTEFISKPQQVTKAFEVVYMSPSNRSLENAKVLAYSQSEAEKRFKRENPYCVIMTLEV